MRKQLINKFLIEDPRTFNDDMDNKDGTENWSAMDYNGFISNQTAYQTYQEFSHCNQLKLLEKFLSLNIGSGVIVEIGVSRNNFENTSTYILTKYKTPETIYLGIDIDNKSFLDHKFPNTHTLISKSEDYQRVLEKFRELEITEIDFLLIDGWHSINQVIDELFWVEMVKPGGYIAYHDTNLHPGPSKIVNIFRPDIFSVEKCCESPLDWGITFVKKLV